MRRDTRIHWPDVRRRLKVSDEALQRALHPDEETIQKTLLRRAQRLANRRTEAAAPLDLLSLLVFRIGDDRYAFPLADVAGVGPLTRCVPVPGGPPELCGVILDGGEARSVLDLARLLGRTAGESAQRGFFVRLRANHCELRVRVDGLEQALHAAPADLAAGDAQGLDLPEKWVEHVHRDGIVVLRADALCAEARARISNSKRMVGFASQEAHTQR